jgi:glycosyltransferase involved in cell wall biosynthesis
MIDYTVTFATHNCLDYTKQCVDSLLKSGVDAGRIVAVDNASNDGTPAYLQQLGLGSVIINKQNLSCGTAWNQGILAQQSEWTIVMNNDIVVAPDFVKRLIAFATKKELKLVSPARIDGPLDYDFPQFAEKAQTLMNSTLRWKSSNAICMCIHRSLFQEVGFFRASPKLLGFEDGLFYNEVRKSKIPHATTGSVWIHHFGGVTQEHIKNTLGIKSHHNLVTVQDRKLYNQSWLERKFLQIQRKNSHRNWRQKELREHDMTLHGNRVPDGFIWH